MPRGGTGVTATSAEDPSRRRGDTRARVTSGPRRRAGRDIVLYRGGDRVTSLVIAEAGIMKLSWRRNKDVVADRARGLTGPERAAALGVADESEPEPAAAPVPAAPGPVMLTLTTRSRIEQDGREAAAAAAAPVRRRMERGMYGGEQSTGGGCSSGGCG
ncbi:hypothetical protein FAGKG844_160018 [Frankia sp. AgKG'84/4]